MSERVLLVYLETGAVTEQDATMQREELQALVETAGGTVVDLVTQKRPQPDPKTVIGSGKISAINRQLRAEPCDLIIFYQALTPAQVRNLQNAFPIPVIDRVQLILDIFALRAHSKEAKLQVALAQKEYLLPRLQGMGETLSRLGGGIGTRGPGETKLENDRRVLRAEIQQIKRALKKVAVNRALNREKRNQSHLFRVGLFGYTNAGKSTLMNGLADAQTLEQNALFATLSPLTRTYELSNHFRIALTDTVGFIQDLPPMIIDAFHSTLEESRSVDLLLIVIDISNPYADTQRQVVEDVLHQLDMDDIPHRYLYNKVDRRDTSLPTPAADLMISAKNPDDLTRVNELILSVLKEQYLKVERMVAADALAPWLKASDHIYIESLAFDAETNQYQLTAYLHPDDYAAIFA